ncbi:MAG: type II toxin-antitoxin system prevent-host-death family antitoxin [Verrucomicrobiota bacterium]
MNTIAATEVKAHLSEILDRVDQGEEFVLTRNGRQAAYLGPQGRGTRIQAKQAVTGLLAWRETAALSGPVLEAGETIKALISKGRR